MCDVLTDPVQGWFPLCTLLHLPTLSLTIPYTRSGLYPPILLLPENSSKKTSFQVSLIQILILLNSLPGKAKRMSFWWPASEGHLSLLCLYLPGYYGSLLVAWDSSEQPSREAWLSPPCLSRGTRYMVFRAQIPAPRLMSCVTLVW